MLWVKLNAKRCSWIKARDIALVVLVTVSATKIIALTLGQDGAYAETYHLVAGIALMIVLTIGIFTIWQERRKQND